MILLQGETYKKWRVVICEVGVIQYYNVCILKEHVLYSKVLLDLMLIDQSFFFFAKVETTNIKQEF